MQNQSMKAAQQDAIDKGRLRIRVRSSGRALPIENAKVNIAYTGEPEKPIEELTTNANGQTEELELAAPPFEYSQAPSDNQPYSEYTLKVTAEGYEEFSVSGTEILAEQLALQEISLQPSDPQGDFGNIVIPAHTLFGDYPPKIAEAEIKPISQTGEIVLSRVVIPEYVVVHDGSPNDSTATDYYVRYRDYIKNVASSEIYATWPDNTIRANVLAIMSFTLNRVYTEWYRNKGFEYTITSSTAFDHKWIHGRNVFESISNIVDEVFENYLSRPNVKQPILTQYCDGHKVSCPNWMTQWGSRDLGVDGHSTIDILRHFYGDNMYINTAEEVAGIPSSWPGENLDIGASGEKVRQLQEQLNTIAGAYPLLPTISVDGTYGEQTQNAVRVFQSIFDLPQTGVVDYPTWYRVQDIYVGVSRIAELNP